LACEGRIGTLNWLLAQLSHEAGSGAGEVGGALVGEEVAVNLNVVLQHLEAATKFVGGDLAVLDVHLLHERDAVRHHPSVALAGDGAELVVDGEALLMGGDDGREEFAGELLPKMVEKILECAADAAVVVGRAKHDDIGRDDLLLQQRVVVLFPGGVRVKEGQGVFFEIEHVYVATVCREVVGEMVDSHAGDGVFVEATDDEEDVARGI
jgi:hypothetical protein